MEEVTAEVVPSVETVVETPSVETPEVQVTPETPVVETPVATLYDLPDGRKVTAEEVKIEYENLLKDYTQKSQKLSSYENINKPKEEDVPEWKRPDYVPKSYAEVIEIAEQRALDRIKQERNEEDARTKEVAQLVDSQIAEIKKTDAALDESALFAHANKFGFRDLKSAHVNMQAIKQAAIDAEQRTLKNLKARGIDPISVTATPVVDDGAIDYAAIAGGTESALDYLRRITKK